VDFDSWLTSAPARGRRATRVACVSAAVDLGLEVLHPPAELHLGAPPSGNVPRQPGVVWHRSKAIGRPAGSRRESILDLLAHIAECLPHVEALVVWESAVRRGHISRAGLHRVLWPHLGARSIVREVTGLSDSLIETIAVDGLWHAGIALRQQVSLLGHRVDALVGERLVLQFDGHAFHSGADERRRDVEHDARLMLEGFPVLRFAYEHVVERFEYVLRTVERAVEQGLHLDPDLDPSLAPHPALQLAPNWAPRRAPGRAAG